MARNIFTGKTTTVVAVQGVESRSEVILQVRDLARPFNNDVEYASEVDAKTLAMVLIGSVPETTLDHLFELLALWRKTPIEEFENCDTVEGVVRHLNWLYAQEHQHA